MHFGVWNVYILLLIYLVCHTVWTGDCIFSVSIFIVTQLEHTVSTQRGSSNRAGNSFASSTSIEQRNVLRWVPRMRAIKMAMPWGVAVPHHLSVCLDVSTPKGSVCIEITKFLQRFKTSRVSSDRICSRGWIKFWPRRTTNFAVLDTNPRLDFIFKGSPPAYSTSQVEDWGLNKLNFAPGFLSEKYGRSLKHKAVLGVPCSSLF